VESNRFYPQTSLTSLNPRDNPLSFRVLTSAEKRSRIANRILVQPEALEKGKEYHNAKRYNQTAHGPWLWVYPVRVGGRPLLP